MDGSKSCAKIESPHVGNICQRVSLFKEFDKNNQVPALWISSPPGAGKTTLIRSYLSYKKSKPIWFQIDEADSDIASFFYYLKLAGINAAPEDKTLLPILSPEYSMGLNTFSRNFFRQFFYRIGTGNTLVFDNYQDMGETPLLHDLISMAIEEITKNNQIIFISRTKPPQAYTRSLANRQLVEFDWHSIRLTEKESTEISLSHDSDLDEEKIKLLYKESDGWAAGLMLLLMDNPQGISRLTTDKLQSPNLFNYFASLAYRNFEPSQIRFLHKTAYYPNIQPNIFDSAEENRQLELFLEFLVDNNFFTQKLRGESTSYRYHPLFREFLIGQIEKTLDDKTRNDLIIYAANTLCKNGYSEDAIFLYIKGKCCSTAIELILNEGIKLIQQGRFKIISTWLHALPNNLLEGNAELMVLSAQANQVEDMKSSAKHYGIAFDLYLNDNNIDMLFHTWSCAVDFLLSMYRDLAESKNWLDKYEDIKPLYTQIQSPEVHARATTSIFNIIAMLKSDDQDLPKWANANEDLLAQPIHPITKLQQGGILIGNHLWWSGNFIKAKHVLDTLEPLASETKDIPIAQLFWVFCQSMYYSQIGDKNKCVEIIEGGLQLAHESGVHVLNVIILSQGVFAGLYSGDIALAKQYQQRLSKLIFHNSSVLESSQFFTLSALIHLQTKNINGAVENLKLAENDAERSLAVFPQLIVQLVGIQIELVKLDYSKAQSKLDLLQTRVLKTDSDTLKVSCLINQAYISLKRGSQQDAIEHTRLAISKMVTGSFQHAYVWVIGVPALLSELCLFALENNIEIDKVVSLLKQYPQIVCHIPQCLSQWSWPVRIFAFGQLRISVDKSNSTPSRKVEHRPLELLQILISSGLKGLPVEQAIDAVFPDADVSRANKSFSTALYRLRKKLKHKNAIITESGRVYINDQVCWVDVWAFEELIEKVRKDLNITMLKKALDLYQGSYLPTGLDHTLIRQSREMYKRLLIDTTLSFDNHGLDKNDLSDLVDMYHQVLQHEPFADSLRQKIMVSYNSLGRDDEAKIHTKSILND